MTTTEILLWDVLPYVTIAVFVVGMVLALSLRQVRLDHPIVPALRAVDLLRIASPLFHLGMIAVLAGHVIGLLIPEDVDPLPWGQRGHLPPQRHRCSGALAGIATLVGVVMLIYRRRTSGPVFAATTKNDKTMYVFLVAAICLGLVATMIGAGVLGDGYNYRETVSVWFRSIFLLQPQGELMADSSPGLPGPRPRRDGRSSWSGRSPGSSTPSARPSGYLFRPYVVYRTREREADRATATPRPRLGPHQGLMATQAEARHAAQASGVDLTSPWAPAVGGSRDGPEASGLEVLERLHQLGLGVHDERAVGSYRLTDRLSAEDEHVEAESTGSPGCSSAATVIERARPEDRELSGSAGDAARRRPSPRPTVRRRGR